MKRIILSLMILSSFVYADLTDKLENLVGYTILESKVIDSWHDANGKNDSFEGCDLGRVIVFYDNTALTCNEKRHKRAFRPTAVILAKKLTQEGESGYEYKMVVENDIYDMKKVQ